VRDPKKNVDVALAVGLRIGDHDAVDVALSVDSDETELVAERDADSLPVTLSATIEGDTDGDAVSLPTAEGVSKEVTKCSHNNPSIARV
jgi:hypothetical protein